MSVEPSTLDIARYVALGFALAAACGLRIFVPLLLTSIAALLGQVTLSDGLEWIGSYPAMFVFAFATLLELAAYHVPWLDNLLDALGAPVATVAGILLFASVMPESDPVMRWGVATLAGGGVAGGVHVALALLRKASSVFTGGFGNFLVAGFEALGAVLVSLLALLLPLVAAGVVMMFVAILVTLFRRIRAQKAPSRQKA